MRTIAIIQARTGSTRLPRKVLETIQGQTMLAHVVQRVRRATTLEAVIVATTTEPSDDPIVTACEGLGVAVFRGSESDVLDRYYQTAVAFPAEAIVRITADCPLIDAAVLDAVVTAFHEKQPDYASNVLERRYPRGLDTEVMRFATLEKTWREAQESYQRTHVTPYIYQNPQVFRLLSVPYQPEDLSGYRWTVDTADDLALVRAVYGRFPDNAFTWQEVLALVQREPALNAFNQHIAQKHLHEG